MRFKELSEAFYMNLRGDIKEVRVLPNRGHRNNVLIFARRWAR
jgi:hypothetical protein